MDFKGHVGMNNGGRCHPLTILDDHSRYNILLLALANERGESVQAALVQAFTQYGLPERINIDNGAPWARRGGLTQLAVWLIRLGIRLSFSRPYHPQTNGKDERFHRSLKAEVFATHPLGDLQHAQQLFDNWRYCYNHVRPHEALDIDTPVSRYRISPRTMPTVLPPIEYPSGDLVQTVHPGGWILLQEQRVHVGTALVGLPVACRPKQGSEGAFDLYFCHPKIGETTAPNPPTNEG